MIAIIDYGMGNLRSVQKALEKMGASAIITQNPQDIKKADKVVLPGVGAMKSAMERLESLGLIPIINEVIKDQKPFLGICLGFQLLFESGQEGGAVKGLGLLPGTVERFLQGKVPHIGWNQLHIQKSSSPILPGIKEGDNVYFCHSYFVKPSEKNIIATTTVYGIEFVSSIFKKNILGVQFHPEKSQTVGLKILKNFIAIKV